MTEAGKETLNLRRASVADVPSVLALFDEVIAWFVSIGNLQQWGGERWSTVPRRIGQVSDACALPGAWVAQNDNGEVRGFLALGESMPYVPAPTGPELYVRVLVASRDARVRGIGRRLMAFADEQARAAGLDHLRVDCYAGGTGDLVRFYESCGYTRITPFTVEGWPGMLLGRRL
ncbi:GNAT family N-acetyltransferase [Stenotrophomonas maltophilia]